MHRYFLHLSFNGGLFCGWQTQPNAQSVQAEIEMALSTILQHKTKVMGCGRTDTGVHAHNFYAHFDSENKLDNDKICFNLNRILPPDIAIKKLTEVNKKAHARFDANSRTYRYYIHYKKDPFKKGQSWYLYNKRLDFEFMNTLCKKLIGENDFSAFEKKGSDNEHSLCRVESATWVEEQEGLYFEITANRFLRNMVRAIVGTLVEAGEGKITEDDFQKIIQSKDRNNAGMSVPAEGLFLWEVQYPKSIYL